MHNKKKFTLKHVLLIATVIIVFMLGVSYAYFSMPGILGNATDSNVVTLTADYGNVIVNYLEGNVINTDTLLLPENGGDSVSMLKFTVENTGSINQDVIIHWHNLENTFCQYQSNGICTNDSDDIDVRDEINYSLYECLLPNDYNNADTTNHNGCIASSAENTAVPITDSVNNMHTADKITLSGQTTRYFLFVLTVENKETLQSYQQNKHLSATIKVDFTTTGAALPIAEAILNEYEVLEDDDIAFTSISNYNNGQGLYINSKSNITSDPTLNTIKYFRGGNVCSNSSYNTESDCTNNGGEWSTLNNYVSFANMRWRVLTINSDGNVRIISEESVISAGRFSPTSMSGSLAGVVGYTYDNTGVNTEDGESSRIKTELDNFYTEYLSDYSNHIYQNTVFCNDTSYTESGTTLMYGARTRFDTGSKKPTFSCPTTSVYYGGVYTTNIGTITADEVTYAGGKYGENNNLYFLNNGTSFWTLSPYSYFGTYSSIIYVGTGGNMANGNNSNNLNTRAVIELKPDTMVTGSGTILDPWTVD